MNVYDSRVAAALCLWLEEHCAGRRVRRVVPVDRHGLFIEFSDHEAGLLVDTLPGPGVALLQDDFPPRLKGGRGTWPDAVGFADRELQDQVLSKVTLAQDGALEFQFTEGKRLALFPGPSARQGCMCIEQTGPNQRWLPSGAEESPGRGGWGWSALECPFDPQGSFILLGGQDPSLEVRSRPAGSWRILPFQGDEKGERFDSLPQALAAWYRRALPSAELEESRSVLLAAAQQEARRLRRGLEAIQKEEASAPDPATMRRSADALLAAGPGLQPHPEGGWTCPDPYEPGRSLRIQPHKPGSKPTEEAARLYEKARKHTRGRGIRAQRREVLQKRLGLLETLIPPLAQPVTARQLAEAQETFQKLGLTPRPPPLHSSVRARIGAGTTPFRFFRSPAGFEVLAGRNARQNDLLTFKTAGPEDLWFHAKGFAGTHVVLRVGRTRVIPQEDQLFAARIAAAWSGAPEGEWVDVLTARRKHVRKPKGAPPGLVQVGKSSPLRVRVERIQDSKDLGPGA